DRVAGGSLELHAQRYEGWFGIGALDPVRFGGALSKRLAGTQFTVGDETVPLRLPTDVFDAGHTLYTRGVSIGLKRGDNHFRVAAGATSSPFSSPFFAASRPDHPMAMVMSELRLRRDLTLTTRDLVYQRQTHLAGLEWHPSAAIRSALTAGTGAGEPYAAGQFGFESERLAVQALYARAGDGFHRVLTERAEGSEVDRENAQITFRPTRTSALVLGHLNFMQPVTPTQRLARGTVDQVLASGTIAATSLDAAWFRSRSTLAGGTGVSLGVGRVFVGRVRGDVHLLRSEPLHGAALTTIVGSLHERLSTRLELNQHVTHTRSSTSVSFGGSILSNLLSIEADYQTLYVPFALGNAFQQALMLTVRLQPRGNIRIHLASLVAPDGRVRYTAYGEDYLLHDELPLSSFPSFERNLIRGHVSDETGAPVEGAAIRIGDRQVFTDSRGAFFLRLRKAGEYSLAVALDAFLYPARFEVTEAPASVAALPEDRAPEVRIILRHVVIAAAPAPKPALADSTLRPVAAPESVATLGRARLARGVHFAFDSATLPTASHGVLEAALSVLRNYPAMRVRLDGHCDAWGSSDYNLQLSRRRVLTVKSYLVRMGIDSDRVMTAWYGKALPLVPGRAILADARNRRVEIALVGPGVAVEVSGEEPDLQLGRRPRTSHHPIIVRHHPSRPGTRTAAPRSQNR
ncbi:MAG: OmpA family protein, partial [Candidatus Eisenbacteria bacterium]